VGFRVIFFFLASLLPNQHVAGLHDVDSGWVSRVRGSSKNTRTRMLPRVLFDGWSVEHFSKLFKNEAWQEQTIKLIAKTCKVELMYWR
jgi:chitinase domain-containing protein 1